MPRKAKQPFDKSEALKYLRSKGIKTNSQNETYIKRIYNNTRRREAAGLSPDIKAATGKRTYIYVPRNEERHTKGRWQFSRTSFKDIKKFVEKSNKTRFTFIVTGIATEDSPNRRRPRDKSKPITLGAGPIPRTALEYSIKGIEEEGGLTGDDLIDLMNELGQLGTEWQRIDEISIIDTGE